MKRTWAEWCMKKESQNETCIGTTVHQNPVHIQQPIQ